MLVLARKRAERRQSGADGAIGRVGDFSIMFKKTGSHINVLIIFFLLAHCSICLAQSTFKGLTPGKSTRADLERVLGKPQKKISPTLAEYNGGTDATKIYVQFANESPDAEVLRIELFCESGDIENARYGCKELHDRLVTGWWLPEGQHKRDANILFATDPRYIVNHANYYGPPAFVVYKFRQNSTEKTYAQWHVALYSRELYESAVPKSCTGMFSGVFDTNRGRLAFSRTPVTKAPESAPTNLINITGTYSTGNGKITAFENSNELNGEWKDSTGSGTFWLKLPDSGPLNSFTGEWHRTTGKGTKEGTWEGKCVE